MLSGDEFYDDEVTSPLVRPQAQPKYQYHLYGLQGEFMGITASLKVAKAHKERVKGIYYYRRYEYDAQDRDWAVAKERNLTCE